MRVAVNVGYHRAHPKFIGVARGLGTSAATPSTSRSRGGHRIACVLDSISLTKSGLVMTIPCSSIRIHRRNKTD